MKLLKDRAVAVIYKDKKFLMWWRYRNGVEGYSFPGGTQEDNELIEQTLEREVFEELNLKVVKYRKFYDWIHRYKIEAEDFERREHYFLITDFTGEIKLGAPELLRQSRDNVYRPDWIDINSTDTIQYEPKFIFDDIRKEVANLDYN